MDSKGEAEAAQKGKALSVSKQTVKAEATAPPSKVDAMPSNQVDRKANEAKNGRATVKSERSKSEDKAEKEKKIEKVEQAPAHGHKVVYLTFDDGPADVSEKILDVLKEYDAKATFFMLEPNMRKYAKSVKRMVTEGHAVGLHGVSHSRKQFYRSKDSVLYEMDKARTTLQKITGVNSFLIRVPYGSHPYMMPKYKKTVQQHGYKMWDWNIDSRDWAFRNKRYVKYTIDQLKNSKANTYAPIILLHEFRSTLRHLPELLQYLKDEQYEFKVIDESLPLFQFE